ncbi:MAG: GNAT family N-acetyltransferase [Thermoleophilia bacterium]|jgi:epoxyqueuosine reductase|nr:GNAT family N-acetyltransferase [Thermoleophilia bacterium]
MNGPGLEERIMDRAREEGAALVGIVRIADLKKAPSYAAYDAKPFYPEYEGVEWKDEYRSLLVWGLPHPADEPVLDWWSMKVKGFTPGNRELAAQSKRLRVWVNEELGMGALSAPYQIEYGGAFLKDAAVLAGLGVIGENNILVTPQYGPRVRLRALFLEAELEPSAPLTGFDPCGGCDRPCHRACPKDAFASGRYTRAVCKQEQDQRDVDFEVLDGAIMGIAEPTNVTAYCRACELACPVAREETAAASPAAVANEALREAAARLAVPADTGTIESGPADQTRFVLTEDRWAAFGERLDGKSEVIPALREAAAKVDESSGADAASRQEALAETDDVAGFACGDPALDDFLRHRAWEERASGKTRIAARGGRVAAYFGLRAATVSPPATVEQEPGQPPLDVPAIVLARLAVDGPEQGRGLGEAMLVRALSRCAQASDTMFARAVLAYAETDAARGFCERYGFVPSPTGPRHLLLRMKDVRKTFKSLEA